jgi:uncharacterized protein with FMN-binding domain
MSTQETRQHFKFARRARNWGISALVAMSIGGYSLYQRSAVSAEAVDPLPASAIRGIVQATPDTTTGTYVDGSYTGDSVQAGRWGNVQVTATIENGQITDFKFSDYPHSRSMSLRISQAALPYLMQEAIQAQSSSVDMVSGATLTSEAFIQSLQSALDQAATGATATPTVSMSGTSL